MTIRWPRPTVRLRLTLVYTALMVVTGAALLGILYLAVQQKEKGPATAAQIICTQTSPNGQAHKAVIRLAPTGTHSLPISAAACPGVVGSVLYHSVSSGSGQAEGSSAAGGSLSAPTAAELNQLAATVRASQAHTLGSFRVESIWGLGVLTVVAFGLSWWMAGRALRPVHRITDAARSFSERTLHDRINLQGPNDELKQLADTFDAMLARLDRAFHSQRRFVANASHELRTPLATERVLIDEALANRSAGPEELRSILGQLRANSEETERLIDALLLLARSERGIDHWTPVNMSEAVSSVVEQSAIEATVAGVTVSTALEPLVVSGDPGLLERLAGNLVENSIRHNVPGGTVSVKTRRDLDQGVLEVENTGPVLDPAAVAGLVEPFRRAGPDRSYDGGGVGLGLSIVNAIVDAHRGTLTLTARPEGGLHVRVRLPRSDQATSPRTPATSSGRVTMQS